MSTLLNIGTDIFVIYGLRKCSNYNDLRRINFNVIFDCNHFHMGCFVVAQFVLISVSRSPSAIAELVIAVKLRASCYLNICLGMVAKNLSSVLYKGLV